MPPRAPLLRIPYTDPLPAPRIIPTSANTASGAVAALVDFLSGPPVSPTSTRSESAASPASSITAPIANDDDDAGASGGGGKGRNNTLLLTGAGISVASGLADYRGTAGTYTLNRSYRPIYFGEFCENHEARKRYWARSFLGWPTMERARPNAAHQAVGRLGELGYVREVVTQNVDSLHTRAHPCLRTTNLHGTLHHLVCISCHSTYPRPLFQQRLATLNPAWSAFLQEILATGALETENPSERHSRGLRTNPDGDVDIPGAPYTTFRYPACPVCLEGRGKVQGAAGDKVEVDVDRDGAWLPPSSRFPTPTQSRTGVLKPAVVMFGESIPAATKVAAEHAVDASSRVLVIGSSLATYSAWRLVKRARERGLPIGILNLGGVRGEKEFSVGEKEEGEAWKGVRVSMGADEILPEVVKALESRG